MPVALEKPVDAMPSCFARRFMRYTKFFSVPPEYWDKRYVASLPEDIRAAFIRSSTQRERPDFSPTMEPPTRVASGVTRMGVSQDIFPARISSKTNSPTIILVRDAMGYV